MALHLLLLTTEYPYGKGEPFLMEELKYLSQKYDSVTIIPEHSGSAERREYPKNVEVSILNGESHLSVRNLILGNLGLMMKWWLYELYKSPHRNRYISEFRWNLNRFLGLLKRAMVLENYIVENKPDIVYSYWFNDWASIAAMVKYRGNKINLIVRAHGYDYDEGQQGRGYHPFRYVEWTMADKIIQISEYGINYCRQRFNSMEKLKLSRLGVKDSGISPVGQGNEYTIVSCSNFASVKRLPLLAEILHHVKSEIKWIHYGDGPERDSIFKGIKEKYGDLNFEFKGYIDNSNLMDFYSKNPVDLMINSSILEGIPVSLMEAISFGIPVAGFNICGIPEIANSKTGLLFEEGSSVETIAKSIDDFLGGKSRDNNFRAGVKKFWSENFNSEKNYSRFTEVDLN